MLRALGWATVLATTGCSLALDFSDSKIPKDATIDAPFTAAECAYKEPNDTAATAAIVTTMDVGPAAICANDLDYYLFTVPAMTASVSVQILFKNSVTGDLDLKLFTGDGAIELAASLGFNDNEQIVCPCTSPQCSALAAGNYIFEVFPATAGNVNSYGIALTMTAM